MKRITSRDIQKKMRTRLDEKADVNPASSGFLGLADGVTVRVPGKDYWVYVRLWNGDIIQAYNNLCPATYGLPVLVEWRARQYFIKSVLNPYQDPLPAGFPDGAVAQLSWPGAQAIPIQAPQFTPGLVAPLSGLTVQVYGGTLYEIYAGWVQVAPVTVDLTAHVPGSGAIWALLELNTSGGITVTTGGVAASAGALLISAIPAPKTVPLAAVRLYTGQTSIIQSQYSSDIVDLRFFKNREQLYSAGVITKPTLTDNGDGTITLGSGDYSFFVDAVHTPPLRKYTIAGGTFSLTDNTTNYVIATLGTLAISVTTTLTTINDSDVIGVFTIYREGTELHILDWDELGVGLSNKLADRFISVLRFEAEPGGLNLTETATRIVNISSGKVWYGAAETSLAAFVSNVNECELWYHAAGAWTKSTITQYNNTQYDDGTNLQSLSSGKYSVNWVFREVGSANRAYLVLGNGNYSLSEAQLSPVPVLPPLLSGNFILVGRIIVKDADSTATSIQSAFATQFAGSSAAVIPITTAINDFQAGDGAGNWITKTLAQTITILRTSLDNIYAATAKGVTNGDAHDHIGGDGAQINHTGLSNIGTNTHAQIDTFIGTTVPTTYAPLASPALTGTPTAPTAARDTNTTQLATTAYVMEQGFLLPMATYVNLNPLNASNLFPYGGTIWKSMTFLEWSFAAFSLAAHDVSNYFTLSLVLRQTGGDTTISTLDTKTLGAGIAGIQVYTTTTFSPSSVTGTGYMYIKTTKTGTPSDLYMVCPELRCK